MHTFKKTALVVSGLAALASGPSGAAGTKFECYDFAALLPDTRYSVGDVIETRHATITIKQYFTHGTPATAETRNAHVTSSKIAGGTSPELALALVSVNVVPKRPVRRVRTRLAQRISQTGAFANANIEVNGQKHESASGFAAMDGRSIGRPATGVATISADLPAPASGNWHSGMLKLEATQGGIESFTLGGHTWRIDDMCFAL
jgi:hypothetical protein